MTDHLIIPTTLAAALQSGAPPVGDIRLFDKDNKGVIFAPQEDITAYEMAVIMRLLFRLTLGGTQYGTIPDWRAFLVEHKIERHFKPIET